MLKNYKKHIFIFSLIILINNTALAKNPELFRNPFEPQLPKKVEVVPEETKPEPIKIPEPIRIPEVIETPPPPEQQIPMPELNISGLVWNSDRPQAVINRKVVDIGDTIGEGASVIRIIGISKEGIDVEYYGKTIKIIPKGALYE